MSLNTDYPIREPSFAELRQTFGSLRVALNKTGGSLPVALLLIHNPDRIATSPAAPAEKAATGEFARDLRDAAEGEEMEEVVAIWRRELRHHCKRRPYITTVMDETGLGRAKVVRLLKAAGIDPTLKAWRTRNH